MFETSISEKIKFKALRHATETLFNLIEAKGIKTLVNYPPSNNDLNFALSHICYTIEGSPLSKKKGDEATFKKISEGSSITDFR